MNVELVDLDETELEACGANPTQIVGQTKCYIYLDEDEQHPKIMNALVVSGSDELLIYWQLVMGWGVISP